MHSFQHLDLKTLRKICSKYNLHVKIAKYSKLSKEQLIPHMEKHLHINEQGKIKMREGAYDNVNSELNKMVEELHAKLKAVKEKIKKPKERPIIKLDELEEKKLEEKIKKAPPKKASPKKETKAQIKKKLANEKRLKKLHDAEKKVEENREKYIKSLNKDDYKKYMFLMKKAQEQGAPITYLDNNSKIHFSKIADLMEVLNLQDFMLEDKNEEFEKAKKTKKEILEKMEKIKIPKIPVPTAPPPHIVPKPPTMPPPAHLKKGLNLGGVKLPPKKTFEMAKAEKEALMPKIDMIQQELQRLEKMIHMDEKENKKEHQKLEKEIHEPSHMPLKEPKTEKDKEQYLLKEWEDDNLGYLFDNYDYHKGTGENLTKVIDKLNQKEGYIIDTYLMSMTKKYNNSVVEKYGVKALFDGIKKLAEHYGAEKFASVLDKDIGFSLPKGYLNAKNTKKVTDYVNEHKK